MPIFDLGGIKMRHKCFFPLRAKTNGNPQWKMPDLKQFPSVNLYQLCYEVLTERY